MMKKFFLFLFSFCLALMIAELALRIFGIHPGVHTSPRWFHEADMVFPLKGFVTDSNGIFKIDPEAAQYADSIIANYTYNTVPRSHYDLMQNGDKNRICLEIYGLDHYYFDLKENKIDNDFTRYLGKLRLLPPEKVDDADSAVLWYVLHPVNQDGFRSIEFKKYRSKKKKVLLLGDSFTFGHSASNPTSSFADILLSKGYIVYNTGITATDPAQYNAIAKKYIPLLQPDLVIVNFFMGNDVMFHKRQVFPYGPPVFYITNAGFIDGCPDGVYFKSAQEAYDFTTANYRIPTERNTLNRFLAKTSIGTVVWKVLNKYGKVETVPTRYDEYYKEVATLRTQQPYSNVEIADIKSLAERNNCKFYLVVIPNYLNGHLDGPGTVPHLFDSLEYFVPAITLDAYNTKDLHYNDIGHKEHAEFLDSLIRTIP
ncbi:MAG: hypothetical protein JWO06_3639 [Bacteroidota bacterium]|nr:hypothetical protein [Bacteroidota bacterium]